MRARRPGRSLFFRRFGLRTSLAGRLLAGGIVFTALPIAGVSGFLLVSRSQQTAARALSNADTRPGVAILDNRGAALYTSECDGGGQGGAPTHPAPSASAQSALPHVTGSLAW